MESRAILILSLFGLACIIVTGSMAIRLTSASASTNEPDSTQTAADTQEEPVRRSHATASSVGPFQDETLERDVPMTSVYLTPRELATADTLEMLLRRVHLLFEPEGSGVRTAMIPHLAEMITIINQHEHLIYQVEIVEPDAALAQRRVETLNDVLRLNVLEPSNLRIVGRQGYRAALVKVSGS